MNNNESAFVVIVCILGACFFAILAVAFELVPRIYRGFFQ